MMRELRKMQDSVRGELEQVLHPDFSPHDAESGATQTSETFGAMGSIGETDHAALPPGSFASDMSHPAATFESTNGNAGDYPTDNVTDDGFAGPRSFS